MHGVLRDLRPRPPCDAQNDGQSQCEISSRFHPVKILHKYVLKEHLGPLTFALTALTSLLLLNYIAKQFGELVGKGLPWGVIGEFLGLSLPFTLALTLPMTVLVATLYAFSRLAADNEITALKATGVGMVSILTPVLIASLGVTLFMLFFNDQVIPRSNHRLAVLQSDIAQTKPTFALREQVINEVSPGKLYMRANHIDEGSNRMREVTIYDMSDASRRRTIYADSGTLAMAPNRTDLLMVLYDGSMQDVPTNNVAELQRLFFHSDQIRVKGVANQFQKSATDVGKGNREMSVCEMQQQVDKARHEYTMARETFETTVARARMFHIRLDPATVRVTLRDPPRVTLGGMYCSLLRRMGVPALGIQSSSPEGKSGTGTPGTTGGAAHPPPPGTPTPPVVPPSDLARQAAQQAEAQRALQQFLQAAQRRAQARARQGLQRQGRPLQPGQTTTTQQPGHLTPRLPTPLRQRPGAPPIPLPGQPRSAPPLQLPSSAPGIPRRGAQGTLPPVTPGLPPNGATAPAIGRITAQPFPTPQLSTFPDQPIALGASRMRMDDTQATVDSYEVEIHKKFALAVACFVFVLLGAPIALRFPRAGVGLTIGVSLFVFALYYIGLIAGASLGTRGIIPPWLAMWLPNLIFGGVGVVLVGRMNSAAGSVRSGGGGERLDRVRQWFSRRLRTVGIFPERRAAA